MFWIVAGWVFSALAGILGIILLVPLDFEVDIGRREQSWTRIWLRWGWGLFRWGFEWAGDTETLAAARSGTYVLGLRLPARRRRGDDDHYARDRHRWSLLDLVRNRRVAGVFRESLGRLVRAAHWDVVEADLEYGFDDPFATGMINVFVLMAGSRWAHRLRPNWAGEILNGRFHVQGWLFTGVALAIVIRAWRSRPVRHLLTT